MNALCADLTWKLNVGSDPKVAELASHVGELRATWHNGWCERSYQLPRRVRHLLCRGPKYTPHQTSSLSTLLGRMQQIYSNAQVCESDVCYHGEPDLDRLMQTSRDPALLLWSWQEWRRAVGPPIRMLYPAVVNLMNQGARNNGYSDIGECWREELETPDLEQVVEELYRQVEPLYKLLHAVVRYRLGQLYGTELVPPTEPIPAHLL
ncbi:hypothetical protein L9F63_003324, partial [Diploptera punctata]